MSYLNTERKLNETTEVELNKSIIYYKVVPKNTPCVSRNCPKCGKNAIFINTKKFRVNANKKVVDIWMIYQCVTCKSTWNLTIFERINPWSIDCELYEKFLANDEQLAFDYGYNLSLLQKNKAVLMTKDIDYDIIREIGITKQDDIHRHHTCYMISCDNELPIKIVKILADILNISGTKIKKLYKEQEITIKTTNDITKIKLGYGVKVLVREND